MYYEDEDFEKGYLVDKVFIEIQQTIPSKVKVCGEYDVVVIGGGFAGAAAALASKRRGKSVIVIDKRVMLGGLATAGIISHYLAICDGHGRKIISGISEELMRTVIKYGYDTLPDEWREGPSFVENANSRYNTWFSVPEGAAALEEQLIEEGVDLLYDATLTDAVFEEGVCKAVIIEGKDGKSAYVGKVFIDASGDAVLFEKCGFPTVYGQNLVSYGAHHMDIEKCKAALASNRVKDALEIHWYGDFPVPGRQLNFPLAEIHDSKDETSFIKAGRSVYSERMKSDGKTQEKCTVLWPSMMLARKTRRMEGEYVLTDKDVNCHFEDSVGAVDDWRNVGPIYEIPFRALYNSGAKNLLSCGRCISSDEDAWEVTRVIPPATLTGQAAGTAAAMMIDKSCDASVLDVQALQEVLAEDKVMIHF